MPDQNRQRDGRGGGCGAAGSGSKVIPHLSTGLVTEQGRRLLECRHGTRSRIPATPRPHGGGQPAGLDHALAQGGSRAIPLHALRRAGPAARGRQRDRPHHSRTGRRDSRAHLPSQFGGERSQAAGAGVRAWRRLGVRQSRQPRRALCATRARGAHRGIRHRLSPRARGAVPRRVRRRGRRPQVGRRPTAHRSASTRPPRDRRRQRRWQPRGGGRDLGARQWRARS